MNNPTSNSVKSTSRVTVLFSNQCQDNLAWSPMPSYMKPVNIRSLERRLIQLNILVRFKINHYD